MLIGEFSLALEAPEKNEYSYTEEHSTDLPESRGEEESRKRSKKNPYLRSSLFPADIDHVSLNVFSSFGQQCC